MESAIPIEDLVKRFGDLIVLDGIDRRRAWHRWMIMIGLRRWDCGRGLHKRRTVR